ncbi:MAG TPA: IS110 family transposase [Vicinamibacterales bacterium]|jgi:transposase|nr:IS110 family transposase [Vicinamibacterales bacterium]
MKTTTRVPESTAPAITATTVHLLLAFELGERTWKLGFTTGFGQRPRIRQVPAGAVDRVLEEIGRAKRRLKLPDETAVISCYEAGRDGFWLHRYLVARSVINHVVDSSSIEVNRRARRAKTDKLDLAGLLNLLARSLAGDRRAWRVVRVPTVAEEDARQLHRTRETLQKDRTRLICRLQGLLVTQGVRLRIEGDFLEQLDAARLWDGTPVPAGLRARVTRVWTQLELLNAQLEELDADRAALRVDQATDTARYVERLPTLRGIGPVGAWVLATEIFGWREIRNARQLGGLVGLVPAPFQSGETDHDQGITRAGNKHVRRLMVQLAWSWRRWQPTSALTRWYEDKFGRGSRRLRRIGIVALARKLLIALWRYVEQGVMPEGADLKTT